MSDQQATPMPLDQQIAYFESRLAMARQRGDLPDIAFWSNRIANAKEQQAKEGRGA